MKIDGHKLRIIEHAIEQFRQRCRPALDFKAAKGELFALFQDHGKITVERPDWTQSAITKNATLPWVLIGDCVAFPIRRDGTVTTCLPRGGIHPEERARRTARRLARRGFRRAVKIGNDIGSVRRERKADSRRKQEAWS